MHDVIAPLLKNGLPHHACTDMVIVMVGDPWQIEIVTDMGVIGVIERGLHRGATGAVQGGDPLLGTGEAQAEAPVAVAVYHAVSVHQSADVAVARENTVEAAVAVAVGAVALLRIAPETVIITALAQVLFVAIQRMWMATMPPKVEELKGLLAVLCHALPGLQLPGVYHLQKERFQKLSQTPLQRKSHGPLLLQVDLIEVWFRMEVAVPNHIQSS